MAFPDNGPSTQQPVANASQPSPAVGQPQAKAAPEGAKAEVNEKYTKWRAAKRPVEIRWFLNSAAVRGLFNLRWNDAIGQLDTVRVPQHKLRPSINKIIPKYRQRKAKFLKNRYTPVIVPASSDREDKMNATASQSALEYSSRKKGLEKIYRQVLDMTLTYGKAFIWLYWDNNDNALMTNPEGGQQVQAPLGDVCYEAGDPFEVLVPDMGIQRLADQPEVMRVRAVPLQELKKKYGQVPGIDDLKGDSSADDLFMYQRQIASLATRTNAGLLGGLNDQSRKDLNYITRKELITKPNGQFPNGRYIVVAGDLVLKYQEEMPWGFKDMENPYHAVEFTDIDMANQFWSSSMVEQLYGVQQEYNDLRAKLVNHMNKQVHPKVIVSVHSKWPQNAWNDEAGEVIRVVTPPGVMTPQIITPPAIATDLWNNLNIIRQEMDEISGLPPVAAGETGQATSGFQVNLLQEATDSVHAPDIRGHELAFEELYRKVRKMMAQGYDIPRLISIAGRAHIPDVVEFSQNNIDENADIIVYTGSALSNSPAVRTQQVLELWNTGLLQDDMNPAEGKRRALAMLDENGIGEFQEEKRRDEEKARLENLNITKGQHVRPPLPFDDHQIHYMVHTDQMKSPEFDLSWDELKQKELFAHTLMHMRYIAPDQAINTAMDLGMYELIPILLPPQMPQQAPASPGDQGASAPVQQPPPQQAQPQ